MYREATRIDAEADGVVDQGERDDRQECCDDQQYETDFAQHFVHTIDQVLSVGYVRDTIKLLQVGGNLLDRVVVGIVGLQAQLDLCRKGVFASKLGRVGTQLFRAFFERLLLARVFHVGDVVEALHLFAQCCTLRGSEVGLQYHGDGEVLLHIVGEVASCEYG